MSKPYFAYENLVSGASLTARTENPAYPASNLNKQRLWARCRSADQCLLLNGTDESAYLADHSDFNITGDLTIEVLFRPDDPSGQYQIVQKHGGADGYSLEIHTNNLRVTIYNSSSTNGVLYNILPSEPLVPGVWIRVKLVYNASAQEISIYMNGSEIARANNSTSYGCSRAGTIPSSIGTSTANLNIGTSGFAQFLEGAIAFVGIDGAKHDHGGYLDPAVCRGYWEFLGNLADSSGNGHTLTGNGLDATNYDSCTAFQWIRFLNASDENPALMFLDRRHNLSTGATLRACRQSPFDSYDNVGFEQATAGSASAIDISSSSDFNWWLEIHDPNNADGYIEIPYVYLGSKAELTRGFLRGYRHSERRHGSMLPGSAGGYTAYVRSEKLWEADLRYRALPGDLVAIRSLASETSLGRPFVFSHDGSAASTRLAYWANAMTPDYTHKIGDQNIVDMQLREAGGGL